MNAKKLVLLTMGLSAALGAIAAQKVKPVYMEPKLDAAAVRAAIEDLMATYGNEYPRGKEFLARLDAGEPLPALQREALAANPLVSGQPILFVTRNQYKTDHHNTATLFQTGERNTYKYNPPGVLKMLDISGGWKISTLFNPGPTALIRDPEVSLDGTRVIFSMRKNIDDDSHLYEINVDGSGLKQLTSARGVSDIDPLYLPNGDIIFSSSREPKYCMCNRHIMANLFRMEADGANIHQIGKSTLFEGHSSLMPDGRILYDRWEYVDRNFGDAQGLWTVNPDGTNHAIYWGNNTASPGGVIDARMIPGTSLCLCIFGSCHDRPWGSLAIINRSRGVDGKAPVVRTWPAAGKDLVSEGRPDKGNYDAFKSIAPRYEDPYPLSEKYFLASRETGKNGRMGIYLVDLFGNEVLLHKEAPGCFDPMPVASRPVPAMKPSARNFSDKTGLFYLQDVYIGTHMKGVERGSVKYLRIIETPGKQNWIEPQWGGQGSQSPGMNWSNFESKRILGTVPVEEDGSACFEAPADCFFFFQALDKDGMMVQSMRSGTMIQPGEVQGCVGCHENRVEDAPDMGHQPSALKRAPSELNGWYGEPRTFSFMKEVQPIFDKHCLQCHDFGKKGAEKLILAGDRTVAFNASYIDLQERGAIHCIGAGPARTQQAYSWGSHQGKLIQVLQKGHQNVALSNEEMNRLITWLDLNAPYYPVYDCAYPNNPCGRSPITSEQLKTLEELTGVKCIVKYYQKGRSQISFDRPEKSPCLANLEKGSPEYGRALAIIQAGQAQLKQMPRADMDGFVPNPTDLKRIARYEERQEIEQANRAAIRDGKKVYDHE